MQTVKLESSPIKWIAFAVGGVGVLSSALGYLLNHSQFFHSYLTAFAFWVSIGLGAMFLAVLHFITGATWSTVIRRIPETMMSALPWMLLFAVPIILGIHELYHWSHADAVAHDELLQAKQPFLNTPFFTIRTVFYFLVWGGLVLLYYQRSVLNDYTGDADLLKSLRRWSPPAMILFALTLTFASFDWMMSLDPHWYSTIYGVYYFAGSVTAAISVLILLVVWLDDHGPLHGMVSVEHIHDLGKLLFTFTVFWAYIAFSQYFLIWYANMPEETVWFLHRWQGSWKIISLFLVFGHFLLPFLFLLPRAPKRNKSVLVVASVWLLLMHFIDMIWLVLPTFQTHDYHIHWLDFTTLIGIGGVFIGLILLQLENQSVVPINDPKLEESIQHRL